MAIVAFAATAGWTAAAEAADETAAPSELQAPAPTPASASASARTLSLAEAMRQGRNESRPVAAAEAKVLAAEARERQARSHRLPTVSVEQAWMYTDSPADVFGLQLNQERFSFADFVAGDPNDPDWFDNSRTRLELSLPLYTGGELSGRIQQAELARTAEEEAAEGTGDQGALTAAQAYVQLAQAREQVALLERSLETVTRHAQRAQAFVDQGLLVRSELLRAQVEQARIEDLLSAARGQARVAEANLSLQLGEELDRRWELEPLADPPPLEGDLDEWIAAADERPDLRAARNRLAAGELEAQVQRAAGRPRVGLVVRQDFFDEFPIGTNGSSTAVMAVARMDLFSGGRHRAAAAAARADAEAAGHQIAWMEDGVRLEVRDAYEQARSARQRHRTAVLAQDAADEGERIVSQRFAQGVAQIIDLLDATTARREAATRELVARADAHLAALRLAVAAGQAPETMLRPNPNPVEIPQPSVPDAAAIGSSEDPVVSPAEER